MNLERKSRDCVKTSGQALRLKIFFSCSTEIDLAHNMLNYLHFNNKVQEKIELSMKNVL